MSEHSVTDKLSFEPEIGDVDTVLNHFRMQLLQFEQYMRESNGVPDGATTTFQVLDVSGDQGDDFSAPCIHVVAELFWNISHPN